MYVPGAHGDRKRAWGLPELERWRVVSYRVGVGRERVLYLLCLLSRPSLSAVPLPLSPVTTRL